MSKVTHEQALAAAKEVFLGNVSAELMLCDPFAAGCAGRTSNVLREWHLRRQAMMERLCLAAADADGFDLTLSVNAIKYLRLRYAVEDWREFDPRKPIGGKL